MRNLRWQEGTEIEYNLETQIIFQICNRQKRRKDEYDLEIPIVLNLRRQNETGNEYNLGNQIVSKILQCATRPKFYGVVLKGQREKGQRFVSSLKCCLHSAKEKRSDLAQMWSDWKN